MEAGMGGALLGPRSEVYGGTGLGRDRRGGVSRAWAAAHPVHSPGQWRRAGGSWGAPEDPSSQSPWRGKQA